MQQPNINKMLKQVQQMQADMMKAQEQLGDDVAAEDLEMLQDTLVAAVNEASRSAEELASRKLGGLSGGLGDLGLPGMPGG